MIDDKLGTVIKDIDKDGIDEIIENISYNDYQQHLVQTTKKWDEEKFGVIKKAVLY